MQSKTIGTIKVWSVIVGILSLSSLLTLSVYPVMSAVGIFSVIAILLGLAVAYAGIQVANMDRKTVNMIFWAKFVWLILNLLLSLVGRDVSAVRILIIVVQGAIVWYLIVNLKKLAAPASPSSPVPTV